MFDNTLPALTLWLWLGFATAALLAFGFARVRLGFAALALGWYCFLAQDASGTPRIDLLELVAAASLAAVAWFPETRLISLRGLAWLAGLLGAGLWAASPQPVGLQALAMPLLRWPGWYGMDAVGLMVVLALAGALLRWLRGGGPAEMALFAGVLPVLLAMQQADHAVAALSWALSAAVLGLGALVAAYRMAFIDPLTGLPNRRALDERLARSGGRVAIAMVDVDHFKRFNDRYGHESGDRVLRRVAHLLRRCRGGTAYRYGGEEFAIVFEGRGLRGADTALESLRERIEATGVQLSPGKQTGKAQAVRRGSAPGVVHVTVSMGLAERGAARRSVVEVMEAADKALYRAKQRGRNRLVIA